jgi:prepilin-type N-terminal cleavage/methylation domain-containing protein
MAHRPEYRTRKFGFTLVELLVVVAIIGLLIAILMPALGRAKRQAQSAVCLSRLKQLGGMHAIYAQENNGVLVYITPYWPPFPGSLASDTTTGTFDALLCQMFKLDQAAGNGSKGAQAGKHTVGRRRLLAGSTWITGSVICTTWN